MSILRKKSKVDKLIEESLTYLEILSPDSEEYSNVLKTIERLNELKNDNKSRRRVSPDTIALIIGNLVGIGLILGYEKAGVITSKALGFVLKGRV